MQVPPAYRKHPIFAPRASSHSLENDYLDELPFLVNGRGIQDARVIHQRIAAGFKTVSPLGWRR